MIGKVGKQATKERQRDDDVVRATCERMGDL